METSPRLLTDAELARCELFIAAARVRSRQHGHRPDFPAWVTPIALGFCCAECMDGGAEAYLDRSTLEMVYHDAPTRVPCTEGTKGGGV